MPSYRIKKAGYFMGTFYDAGTDIELDPKQAKYALMSGQLEDLNAGFKLARPHGMAAKEKETKLYTPPKPHSMAKPKRDAQNEFRSGSKVGGTFGGEAKK